jgi:hypothetical protein
MNIQHFQAQVNRLAETFGAQYYKRERVEILWKSAKDLSDEWFSAVVDNFIGNMRQAPLMPEFQAEIGKERDRLWQQTKQQERREAKAFMSVYAAEDLQGICANIRKRVAGDMANSDFDSFVELLGKVPSQVQALCRECQGDGLIFHRPEEGGEEVFRCYCGAGMRQPAAFPAWVFGRKARKGGAA